MEVNFDEDYIEEVYWTFDAMRSGYAEYKLRPYSERDAFKAMIRKAIYAHMQSSSKTEES